MTELDRVRRWVNEPLRAFFEVEVRNEDYGGVRPSTLDSAVDSLLQAPDETLTDWFDDDPIGGMRALAGVLCTGVPPDTELETLLRAGRPDAAPQATRRRKYRTVPSTEKEEGTVWTITIRLDGEADSLFDAMLQTIPAGYIVAVTHGRFAGDAEFVAVGPRSIIVRPFDSETESRGEPTELDWAGLDVIEVH
jgi:hypothetical protein